MIVRLWGTRGSIPSPLTVTEIRTKLVRALSAYQQAGAPEDVDAFCDSLPFEVRATYGGQTCCVQVEHGGKDGIFIDCGSGLRSAGGALMTRPDRPTTYHIFLSHFHWDHIQGLPFFVPCYIPGTQIHFYAIHPEFEDALRGQQLPPYFPVDMNYMSADFHFHQVKADEAVTVDGCSVTPFMLNHPGGSYGFDIQAGGRKCIYASDCEYVDMSADEIRGYIKRYADSDLLIFDAQYTLEEIVGSKYTWGHSTYSLGLDFCRMAKIKQICFYHHDPMSSDDRLAGFLRSAREYRDLTFPPEQDCQVHWGYDGLSLSL